VLDALTSPPRRRRRPSPEAAEIVDALVAHILEQLAAQGGAAAGTAVNNHILVLGKKSEESLELLKAFLMIEDPKIEKLA
jgi:hypothetical protein